MKHTIEFTKMHGTGNDYIYINTDKFPIAHPQELAIQLSKSHTGIGSDGLILISKSDKADFRMRMFNEDGSEGLMCGNGCRCIGKYVYEHALTTKTRLTLETMSGIKTLQLHVNNNIVETVSVGMGNAEYMRLGNDKEPFINKPISIDNITMNGTAVSMGNPHLIFFVNDVESIDITDIGSKFECHSLFPDRTNVEFAQILSPTRIRMRVWERGSGITMACGTGACATVAAAVANKLCLFSADVVVDGGTLHIQMSENDRSIVMTGAATTVFEGNFTI